MPSFADLPAYCQLSCRHVPGWARGDVRIDRIAKGGSDRRYYRLRCHGLTDGPATAILMTYTDERPDNESFFPATEVLSAASVNVPELYAHDIPQRMAWMEDLGERDLGDELKRDPQNLGFYKAALDQIRRVHLLEPENVAPEQAAQMQHGFDAALYQWEQDYFFDQFASRFSAVTPDELDSIRNRPALGALRDSLAGLPRFLVHRDFQSQNVIVRDGDAWLIDYQGLRPGRPEYDIASLLFDPYVALTLDQREELADYYFDLRRTLDGWQSDPMIYKMAACQRLMQALGAYGRLGTDLGKPEFLQWIAPATATLRGIIERANLLPELLPVLEVREELLPHPAPAGTVA